MQRNRTPLEELRQVAEAALQETSPEQSTPIQSTECLGVCSPGHVMGIADEQEGVYVFNGMDNPDDVHRLTDMLKEGRQSGTYSMSDELRGKLEARLGPERVRDIPWQDRS